MIKRPGVIPDQIWCSDSHVNVCPGTTNDSWLKPALCCHLWPELLGCPQILLIFSPADLRYPCHPMGRTALLCFVLLLCLASLILCYKWLLMHLSFLPACKLFASRATWYSSSQLLVIGRCRCSSNVCWNESAQAPTRPQNSVRVHAFSRDTPVCLHVQTHTWVPRHAMHTAVCIHSVGLFAT